MKILSLYLQNFLTIGEAEIDLADRGLVLIQGENTDDSSALSNGAGKSSIVDGLCWVLFGTTARGITGDSVVNLTAKKNTMVASYIQDGADTYRVARHRKHPTHKNALLVDKVDSAGNVTASLTKGTDRETQEVVNTIVGCSYEVFTSSIYAGQEQMPDLPAMTDKFLKTLIEEAAGVQVLEKAHAVAKAKLAEQKSIELDLKHKHELSKAQFERLDAQLLAEIAKEKNFDETKRDRVKAKLAEVLDEQKAIKDAEAAKAKYDKAELLERKSAAQDKLKAANEINKQAQEAKDAWRNADYQAKLVQQDYENREKSLRSYIAEIKSIDSLVGTGCKECGKEICSHDIADARNAKLSTAKALRAELDEIKAKLTLKQEAADAAKREADEAMAKVVNVVEISEEIQRIDNMIKWVDGVETKIGIHKANIDAIKKRANEMYVEPNPYTAEVASLRTQLVDAVNKMNALKDELDKMQAVIELHTQAVGVYGAGGVRAHILDTVTPFLNDRTREYLGALADGNIHATWTTLTKSAKGELKEKFSIAVTNDKGANSFAGLSGGEKRKVRLATALALQDLVASRATKPIELFVGDEIDDALDAAGIERLMTVLERKARERGTVLVISHNDLNHFIDQSITVIKAVGQSKVIGDVRK